MSTPHCDVHYTSSLGEAYSVIVGKLFVDQYCGFLLPTGKPAQSQYGQYTQHHQSNCKSNIAVKCCRKNVRLLRGDNLTMPIDNRAERNFPWPHLGQ